MKRWFRSWIGLSVLSAWFASACSALPAQDAPEVPRIDSLVILEQQPAESDLNVIWFDDFDSAERQSRYAEKSGDLVDQPRFGGRGRSLRMNYPKGSRGIGGRKVFFGDSPTHRPHVVRAGETFNDVYWRIYVKHPHDWEGGGPAKLSRATSLVPPGWRQAMIAHVWSSGEALTLDPASGVRERRVVTTKYNDFDNLRWLGNKPASRFKLHGSDGAGWWVCVEARARLNTPGKKDGLNQLWIDGRLEAERRDLDWRGDFDERGINAVFLEAYWNQGSPVDQARWFDNFIVSTKPIGPVVCSRNPVLIKTPYRGPGKQRAWQVELAVDSLGEDVVWKSKPVESSDRLTIDAATGAFTDASESKGQLDAGRVYHCRVRQQSDAGLWSAWSPWHQSFVTQ
ncbi:hypothetical protein FYK55_10180 [Roseiconus nitratireducens]|uniref:Ig-like domain-containing protein n=1 Tax=Roseiconus nitratireducens TaxID=2605748 RepID=A0A5M6D7P2_9BACT|nr:hypothetical protein [Roseiconus nitratireducens]KAA5543574.1 hypothetical protein FYK55_10180 [Roseiconus nitratireducens]